MTEEATRGGRAWVHKLPRALLEPEAAREAVRERSADNDTDCCNRREEQPCGRPRDSIERDRRDKAVALRCADMKIQQW